MRTFPWNQAQGQATLRAFRGASGRVLAHPADLQQALMTALVTAEHFAARSGLMPIITQDTASGSGDDPPVIVGGAREAALREESDRASVYLGLHGLVRRANASVVPAPAGSLAPLILPAQHPDRVQAFPIIPVLIFAGVAAVIAGAFWAGGRIGAVEAQGDMIARVHSADSLVALCGGVHQCTPEEVAALAAIAGGERHEKDFNLTPWLVGGGVALAAGTAIYFGAHRKLLRAIGV